MFHRFLIFSGLAAAVNLVTGYILYAGLGLVEGWQYALAVAIGFLAGMGVSFVLNRRYTFEPSGRLTRSEAIDFFAVSVGGLAITTTLAENLRGHLPAIDPHLPPEALAHITAVGLTAIYSFFAHKYVSFRRGRRSDATPRTPDERP
ncbi:GtrA family protein [Paragemmobacter straminiformis]|uniref:GtrA family protein n=1 Tax=Paragemmobacter straminiformis TaxID=2045119 RepID=A0A842IBV4_9RHOB|nr:GtrA family protein [Gemmobacter straminiformis]MBC2837502.1 GtrA family protein [Gemmobacter straminiformis]